MSNPSYRGLILSLAIALSAPMIGACRGPVETEPEAPPASGAEAAPDGNTADEGAAGVPLVAGSSYEVSVETAAEMQAAGSAVLIDVREPAEYDAGHIPGATLIPMSQLQNRLDEIPRDQPVILSCRSGNRSASATEFLRGQGFEQVYSQAGGIVAWENDGQPVER